MKLLGQELKKGKKADAQRGYEIACKEWTGMSESFGRVFAFKGSDLSLRYPWSGICSAGFQCRFQ